MEGQNKLSSGSLDQEAATQMIALQASDGDSTGSGGKSKSCSSSKVPSASKGCPKQLQLPMFLSKTYHMINRSDAEVATWSEAGDNFVVKNVEKFATTVLPLYFKHSNFSSFARQLNFYGFRKLRTDPILTNDVDPRTACYVRFYHEKFQKDKPELLHQIKRATKTDQQSKDDWDVMKQEIQRLKDSNQAMREDFDRRLAELSYECNRRVTSLSADYDKLVTLVQPLLQQSLRATEQQNALASLRDFTGAAARPQMPDLLHSLSHAAVSLQNQFRASQAAGVPGQSAALAGLTEAAAVHAANNSMNNNMNNNNNAAAANANQKRRGDGEPEGAPPAGRQRFES
eukprot:CAMPEP_0172465354 /NCGR_PEP_ID=MMETSP1065-20121228/53257_1 /TAXON_ID=265537 /ORGANISM="Amphiprora paludosa, Strain CCMP125" /LENGTH=342 /DNA_ID=CAMNT_0013221859 /DNA_START=76 /DNA_END=1104 /DNA_ORIENTATION=+